MERQILKIGACTDFCSLHYASFKLVKSNVDVLINKVVNKIKVNSMNRYRKR